MKLKLLDKENFDHYSKCAMVIACPTCTWKCGFEKCQNRDLKKIRTEYLPNRHIVKEYVQNSISTAIVFAGLEPFDSFKDVYLLIVEFRKLGINDDIVIYTGYNQDEIEEYLSYLKYFDNIFIKFGRYIPEIPPVYSKELGVTLASGNQYAIRLIPSSSEICEKMDICTKRKDLGFCLCKQDLNKFEEKARKDCNGDCEGKCQEH